MPEARERSWTAEAAQAQKAFDINKGRVLAGDTFRGQRQSTHYGNSSRRR